MLVPIKQQQISQFAPIDVNPLLTSLQSQQRRQDLVLNEIDAVQEFADTFQVLPEDRALFEEEIAQARQGIESISEVGFVGNRLRQVKRLARDIKSSVIPFEQSRDNFRASRDALEADANLSRQQKDDRIALLRSGLGLRRDSEGRIDSSSVFQKRGFTSAQDLQQIALDAVKGAVASRGVDISGLPTDQLLLTATEIIGANRIQEIAQNAILNDPQAMSFLEDEVEIADFRKRQQFGEGLTGDERNQLFQSAISSPVSSAIAKFGAPRQSKQIVNIPGAGSKNTKTSDPGIPLTLGERPVQSRSMAKRKEDIKVNEERRDTISKAIADAKADPTSLNALELAALEQELGSVKATLAQENADIDQVFEDETLRNQRTRFEEIQASLSDVVPEDIVDPTRAADVLAKANDGTLQFHVRSPKGVSSDPADQALFRYERALMERVSEMTDEEQALNKAVNLQLESLDRKRSAINLQGRTFSADGKLGEQFEDLIKNTASGIGIELLDENFQELGDVDLDDFNLGGYSLDSDVNGNYFLTGVIRDGEDEEAVHVKLSDQQAAALGRGLERQFAGQDNPDALEILVAANNMQGKGVASQLRNMDGGQSLSNVGGDPRWLQHEGEQLEAVKTKNGRFGLRAPDGSFVTHKSGPNAGKPIVFENEQDFNLRWFLPKMRENAGQ